ncbi:hypothetical protein [Glycomyces tenuis]|uniref:hypothetical protein n=1 Tax=Glycomyces tenuis TaxID=58116 RepID=UPI00041B8F5C|nr:hypothetical protein [Glycomyces tenuis]
MPQIASHEHHHPQPTSASITYLGGQLVVDTDAAARHLFAALGLDAGTGAAFTRAWHSRAWLLASRLDQIPETADLAGPFPPEGRQVVRRDFPVHFVADLNAADIEADLNTVCFDDAEKRFLDADRAVQVLRLYEPAALTEVAWPHCPTANLGLTKPVPATRALSTWVLRPGSYLLCWRFPWRRPALVAAARTEQEPTGEAIANLPGFQARRLTAVCDGCGSEWMAFRGETRFVLRFCCPSGGGWNYPEATGRTGTEVDCPSHECEGGRVRLTN